MREEAEYYFDELANSLRDCDFNKPERTEILIEYAKEVHQLIKEKDETALDNLLLVFEMVFILMEFSDDAEWAKELATEMRYNIQTV